MGLIDFWFKDKSGQIVVAQTPNAPLILALVAVLLRLVTTGTTHRFFGALFFGALFTWAWLEIVDGANPHRRAMGSVTLIGLLWWAVSFGL